LNNNYNIEDTKDKYNNPNILIDAFVDAYASPLQFYTRLHRSFLDALFVPFTDAQEELWEIKESKKQDKLCFTDCSNYLKHQQEYYKKYEKIIMSRIRNKFDTNFREEGFTRSLSDFIDSYLDLAKLTGFGQIYQHISNITSFWNTTFIEPIRDTILRTPSHKIYSENKYSSFHYDIPDKEMKVEKEKEGKIKTPYTHPTDISTPVLIIYAFINRHYILDLLPDSSIVLNLQKQGLDIFATDWGTPSAYDKKLTIGHYVNNYLVDAIEQITKHVGTDKVSLFGISS
jgi:polyhydroxyalkanoate synthase subunit PhaC